MRDRTRLPHSALVGLSGARHGRIARLAGSSTFAAAVMLGAALLSSSSQTPRHARASRRSGRHV